MITPFTGTLDGKGHSLKNYTMTNGMIPTRTQVLFSSANGATFKNIKIEGYKATINSRMKGNLKIAGLIRTATKCTFSNVTVSGAITVDSPNRDAFAGDYIAGIAAVSTSSTFKSCTNKVSITVSNTNSAGAAGGIIANGENNAFSSYNTGKVSVTLTTGFMAVGGVAGESAGAANNCYNTGAVSGSKAYCVGGVFGYLEPNRQKVTALYNTGKVNGTGEAKGRTAAIAGFNTGSVTSAYYTSSGKGIVNDAGVKASAKKVSSITFGNCPGLTSSNWKSSKGKLILKWQ